MNKLLLDPLIDDKYLLRPLGIHLQPIKGIEIFPKVLSRLDDPYHKCRIDPLINKYQVRSLKDPIRPLFKKEILFKTPLFFDDRFK
jgi:hypothetical protein